MNPLFLDADYRVSASFFADKHLVPQLRACLRLAARLPDRWRRLHAHAWCLNAEHYRRTGKDCQELHTFKRPTCDGRDQTLVLPNGKDGPTGQVIEVCRRTYKSLVTVDQQIWTARQVPWWWSVVPGGVT